MKYTVFVDKIGNIFNGDINSANEHFEKYKELSLRGVGNFSNKDVYVLDESRNIIKSYGKSIFATGGILLKLDDSDIIRDFLLDKKLDNQKISKYGFMALQSSDGSTLIYKIEGEEKPLIKKQNYVATFYVNNFNKSDIIYSMMNEFKVVCVENAIRFKIE